MKAVLLLAHGAPASLDDVEEYVLHIRHGRPLAPELMAIIKDRYRQVGGSPLLDRTRAQAEGLQKALDNSELSGLKVYTAMRHSKPFIADVMQQMAGDGVHSLVAVCLAPQFSRLTIGAYRKALEDAIGASGGSRVLQYSMVDSYAGHPLLIQAFASRLRPLLQEWPGAAVLFTAHSIPERVVQEGDTYDAETKETARLVAVECGIPNWTFAYQSQGMTSDKWLGPTVEVQIDELHARNVRQLIVVPIGFVCDHVEILYDIDILYRDYAKARSIELSRSPSLNDCPEFIRLLFALIAEARG